MEMITSPISRSPEFHTAPSSPPPSGDSFNYHLRCSSAPASPTRPASAIRRHSPLLRRGSPAISLAPELPDFSFDSAPCADIATADELFHNGRIRSLHPPPSGDTGRRRPSPVSTASRNKPRKWRSLSPIREHDGFIKITAASPAIAGGRKWRLKDVLLFRSASEGRPWKYAVLSSFASFSSSSTGKKKGEEDSRCRSFSSSERGRGSAHEIHYTLNRAAAEEQRKKTPLPYQPNGLFSCLQFNPAIGSILNGLSGHPSRGR